MEYHKPCFQPPHDPQWHGADYQTPSNIGSYIELTRPLLVVVAAEVGDAATPPLWWWARFESSSDATVTSVREEQP